jgi:dihydrolipoamide dehydrogenase
MSESYDLVVIGSGPGGYRASTLAALRGLAVAIVEAADWGGCCLNRGCVPKKDWYHSARLIAANRHHAGRGIRGTLTADLGEAWAHQKRVVAAVRQSYLDYAKRLGVAALRGRAELTDAHTVRVSGEGGKRSLHARHVVLATGSRPQAPPSLAPLPGRILTTDMLFDAPPPKGSRVAIIGGGIVATELAFILSMLGQEVAWLTRSAPLRRLRYSAPALAALHEALRRHGIEPRIGARVRSAEPGTDGMRLTLDDGTGLEVDWLVLGTGRTPNTAGIGLERAGIATTPEGFIARNERLQTSVPHVYAIGDCAGAEMTANHALADASVAVANILRPGSARNDERWVPTVVYSALELARIGLDEEQAEDEGLEPAVGFTAFETSPCALTQDDTEGFVRLVADLDSGALLGGEIAGAEAGELIHLLTLAPDPQHALAALAAGRYNHPARAEELLNATETLAAKWGLHRIFGG